MADADALYDEAVRRLAGSGVRRDEAAARDLFRRAGEAGRPDAAVIHANFVASGTGGARDWPRALDMFERLSDRDSRCRRALDLVRAMDLDEEGNPRTLPQTETVSEGPHIVAFRALFSAAECCYLTEAAVPIFAPASVIDVRTGRQIRDPIRISDCCGFTAALEDPAIHALNRRLAAASGTRVGQGEPLQVLRYGPGGEYKPHFDSIPGAANQRIFTVLVWLNDAYEGGETWFNTPRLALKGEAGDAILFRNALADDSRDPAAAHAGLPVRSGTKLIASRWIRRATTRWRVSGEGARTSAAASTVMPARGWHPCRFGQARATPAWTTACVG